MADAINVLSQINQQLRDIHGHIIDLKQSTARLEAYERLNGDHLRRIGLKNDQLDGDVRDILKEVSTLKAKSSILGAAAGVVFGILSSVLTEVMFK